MIPSSKATSAIHPAEDFLKLENVFSFDGGKINVGTVIFDASTDKARSKNIFTRVFGKIMERRAKEWVKAYVRKNTDHLPGAEEFLKNIKSSSGVRRNEFMSLLVSAKLDRSAIFCDSTGKTQERKAHLSIEKPTDSVINFIASVIGSHESRPSIEFFLNFIEKGFALLKRSDISKGIDFLQKFNDWSKGNEADPLFIMMKGHVNFFRIELEKIIIEFDSKKSMNSLGEKELYDEMKVNSEIFDMDFNQMIDAETNDYLFSKYENSKKDNGNTAEFFNYVTKGFYSINSSSAEKLKAWINDEAQEFIKNIPESYKSLENSINYANEKLKIDLDNFHGDAYKNIIQRS